MYIRHRYVGCGFMAQKVHIPNFGMNAACDSRHGSNMNKLTGSARLSVNLNANCHNTFA